MAKLSELSTLKEASEKLGISYRMARYYAKQYPNDLVYEGRLIYVTERFFEKVEHNRKMNAFVEPKTKTEVLQTLQEVKEEYNKYKVLADKLEKETERFKEIIKTLREELEQYEIEDNERLEVFTNEEYNLFQERLIEWREQRKEIELKDKHFEQEIKSNEELITHYKNLYDYQRTQSERILEMHQKLIDNIGLQLQHVSERNLIEAVEKKVIKRDETQ